MGNRLSTKQHNTALQNASCAGELERVQESLAAGADVDARFTFRHDRWFYEQDTPLMAASAHGHVDIVEELLFCNADIHATDSLGYEPIHQACRHGHLEVVKLLVSKGAHANPPHSARKWSPLHIASCWNHFPVVHWLVLYAKANLCAVDKHDRTPLDVARRFKASGKVIKFLEEHTPGASSAVKPDENEGITDPLLAELSAQVLSQPDEAVSLQRLRFFLIGEMAAGKTSLLRALLGERFVEDLESTVGMTVTRRSTHLSTTDAAMCPLLKNSAGVDEVIANHVAQQVMERRKCLESENKNEEENDWVGYKLYTPPVDRSTLPNDNPPIKEGDQPLSAVENEVVANTFSDVDADKVNDALLTAVCRVLAGLDEFTPGCIVDTIDCGGQLSFAMTHSVCLNPKDAIFLLVFDASKPLDDCGESCLRREGHRDPLPRLSPALTHLDFIVLWMSTITMLAHRHGVKPIVQLVGTHLDLIPRESRQEWCNAIQDRLLQELSGREPLNRLDWRGPYFVDNHAVGSPDSDLYLNDMVELQADLVQDIAEQFPTRKIKVKWLKAEQVLQKLSTASPHFRGCRPFREVHSLLVQLEASESKAETMELLDYLHQVGAVLFFKADQRPESCLDEWPVFLSIEWLAQQAAEVLQLTMKPLPRRLTRYHLEVQQLVKRKGLIPCRMLKEVIWPNLSSQVRDSVAEVMEHFGLFLPFRFAGEACFFAPGCVTRTDLGPISAVDKLQFSEQLPPMLLLLECPLTPHVIFLRILSSCLEHFKPTHYDTDIQTLRMHIYNDCFCAELHYHTRGIVLNLAATGSGEQSDHLEECCLPTLGRVARELLSHVQNCLRTLRGQNFPGLHWRFAFRCARAGEVSACSSRHHWVPVACTGPMCVLKNGRPLCLDVSCERAQPPPMDWPLWLIDEETDPPFDALHSSAGSDASMATDTSEENPVPEILIDEVAIVKIAQEVAPCWEDVAFKLKLTVNQVQVLKMNHTDVVDRCKEMMFSVRNKSGKFHLSRLLRVLKELEQLHVLAEVKRALA